MTKRTTPSTKSWSITRSRYSIWPAHRDNPLGWTDVGKSGPKKECLDYIQEVWTDMRPLSLRRKMDEQAQAEPH